MNAPSIAWSHVRSLPRRISIPVLLCIAVALLIATPRQALASRSFSMPSVSINARIETDGSLSVVERRTFRFSGVASDPDGPFTRVYWELEPPPTGEIIDVSVTGPDGALVPTTAEGRPPGTMRVTTSGNITTVEAYGVYEDGTRTFDLAYRVTNAATRWSDTAELYWQCIAPNWAVGTGKVDVLIKPPPDVGKADVKAWAHGPLTGSVHILDDGSVTLTVEDLPANTFVEPRIVFPAEALPGAPQRSEPKLQEILDTEAQQAEAANAKRRQARAALYTFGGCAVVVPLLLLAITVALFFRYGKEYKPAFVGQYYREPPDDLHPALVGHLWTMGVVEDAAIAATLMDLADRGVIRMEPTVVTKPGLFGGKQENTYLLTLDTSKWNTLGALDQQLLSFLFTTIAGDNTLTIQEMKDAAKSRAQTFQNGINDFKKSVSDEADRRGFVEKSSRSMRALAWTMTVIAGVASFFAASASGQMLLALPAVPMVIAMAILSTKMTRRSPAAAEMHAKYVALRNYLRDFSRLHEAPPASVILWNKFLVLAVVFGIAEQVIEQMRVVVPNVIGDPAFATTYWWAASGVGYDAPISSLSSGFASAASIASSELSSSSGGGGGFSGGGGGGFGGGGGGGAD